MSYLAKLSLIIFILSLTNCIQKQQADLIVHNAKIYTVNELFDIREAMAVKNGKIIAIGPEHEILNKYSADEVIDAKKQTVYPGFIDSYCHFFDYAMGYNDQSSRQNLEMTLLNTQNNLFEVGITTVNNPELSKDKIDLIDQLQQQGKLKVKVYAMIVGTGKMLDYYLKKRPYKTDKLNVCSFIFDSTNVDILQKYASQLFKKGFQVNTNCSGDTIDKKVLDVYGKLLKGVNDKRWRIEYAQFMNSDDLDKFKAYTIIPSISSTSDKETYAYKNILKQNGIVVLGSNFPATKISPIIMFYNATVLGLSREEALKGMTIWAAIANFEENEKGSLEVGKAADFIMLNNDIIETNKENIIDVKVVQTFIDGESVFTSVEFH